MNLADLEEAICSLQTTCCRRPLGHLWRKPRCRWKNIRDHATLQLANCETIRPNRFAAQGLAPASARGRNPRIASRMALIFHHKRNLSCPHRVSRVGEPENLRDDDAMAKCETCGND